MSSKHKKSKKDFHVSSSNSEFLVKVYSVFVFILLPIILIRGTLDGVQPVRLLVLSLFLMGFGMLMFVRGEIHDLPLKAWNNLLIWFMGVFVLVTVLTAIYAINPKETFFDIAKTLSFFIFTLFTIAALMKSAKWPEIISRFIIVASLIAVGVGLYQLLRYVIFSNENFLPDGRHVIYQVKGLMAHKNQYSINLMLMLPFVLYGAFIFKGLWRRMAFTGLISALLMITVINTRSVWTAIIFSVVVVIGFISTNYKKLAITSRQRNILAGVTIAIIITGTMAVILLPAGNPHSHFARLKSITNPNADNNIYRLKIWRATARMIADHPFTGVGSGNWKLHVADYYQNMQFESKQLNWIRPHNDLLWIFAEKGLAGILCYICIFLLSIWYLVKSFFQSGDLKLRYLALLTGGGLIAYHVASLFSFPYERINQQIFFYLYSSIAVVLFLKSNIVSSVEKRKSSIKLLLILLLFFPVIYSMEIIRSDRWLTGSRVALARSDWKQLNVLISKSESWARNLDPEATPLKWYKGLAFSGLNKTHDALQSYVEALKAHPNKITVLHNIGIVYSRLGQIDSAMIYLNKALDILPTYRESLEAKATLFVQQKDYRNTLNTLEKIKPDQRDETIKQNLQAVRKAILDEVLKKAELFQVEGKTDKAVQLYDSAAHIYHSSDKYLEVLRHYYGRSLNVSTFLSLLESVPEQERSTAFKTEIKRLKKRLKDE
ncbi:MAG: hypothetical protein EOM06_09710 [Sphingobacteriia bacterium]|nr:hypothetical protein [Sphingobacteriia bacterium]